MLQLKDTDFTLGQKQQLTSVYKSHFQNMIQRSWAYRMEKIYHMNTTSPSPRHTYTHTEAQLYWCQTKETQMPIILFHLKEQNFMMIKVSLLKEDIMILDLYAPTKAQNTWRKTKGKKTQLQMGKGDQLYDNKWKLNFWWWSCCCRNITK